MRFCKTTIAVCAALAVSTVARAEESEITIVQQYGVSFLPLMVIEKQAPGSIGDLFFPENASQKGD